VNSNPFPRISITVLALIILAFVPILYFPISIHHAIYTRGAESILEGSKPYADFVDIKPPFIYYLFAFKISLFGSGEMSLRIFDLLWQAITLTLLIFTVFKRTGDRLAAWSTGIIYAILYSTLGFSESMQCETLSAWGFILILYFHSADIGTKRTLSFTGACIGWVMGFKYTFGIILPVLFLFDLLKGYSFKELTARYMWIGFSTAAGFSLMLSPLLDGEIRAGYDQVLQYLAVYATFPPFDLNTVRFILKATTSFYSDRFSLFFVILTAIGVLRIFKNRTKNWATPENRLLILSCFFVMALLLSAFIERKVNPYHLSRTYIPLSVLAGIGAAGLLRGARRFKNILLKENTLFAKHYLAAGLGIFFILLFSPVLRWVKLMQLPLLYHTNTTEYNKAFDSQDNAVNRTQHKAVADYLLKNRAPGERTFAMSVAASTIYYFMDERPVTKFANPQFYFSYGCLEAWRQDARRELDSTTWLVVQHTDHQPFLNGHWRSSWESLQQDPLLYPPVKNSFTAVDTIGYFYIFKRNL
jgi:4-amino-4-deoxy-L-arabinose transferase-like glycosyltransferase